MTSQFLDRPRPEVVLSDSALTPGSIDNESALRRLRYELDLPADSRQRRVLRRLRCWLDTSLDEVQETISAFAEARDTLEESERECLDECEESAALDGLSYYEFRRLLSRVPWLRHLDPRAWQLDPRPTAPELFGALTWAMEAHSETI